MSGFPLYFVVW